MSKKVLLVSFLVLILSASAFAYEGQDLVGEYRISVGIPTVDGIISPGEWDNANWLPLDQLYYMDPLDLSNAKWAAMWSPQTNLIYVVVTGTDTYQIFEDGYWDETYWTKCDHVQVYIDPSNSDAQYYFEQDPAQQWVAGNDNNGGRWAMLPVECIFPENPLDDQYRPQLATTINGDILTYEFAFKPYESFGWLSGRETNEVQLEADLQVGLDVIMCSRSTTFGMLCENAWEADDDIDGDGIADGVVTITKWRYADRFLDHWLILDLNQAWRPRPAVKTEDAPADVTLQWNPGKNAAYHQVYFGTSFDEVNDADESMTGIYRGSQTLEDTTYTPAEIPLELGKTYYWRIDEVNGPDVWKGNIWSFTTGQTAQQYLVVDDFESYDSSSRLDDTWWEFGRAMITLQTAADPNYVHGEDGNSMRYGFYNNFSPYYSEIRASIADLQIGPDWTVNGSRILTLYFRADFDNTVDAVQPMAVFVSDGTSTATVEYDDPNDLIKGSEGWKRWNIDLQQIADAGVDLTNVTEMGITIGDGLAAAGVGYVYFDDIRLYPDAPQEPMCWQEQTKLLASDGAIQDRFGSSVSVSGDYAVVGAPSGQYNSGSAYIFVRDGENWLQQAKLLPDGQELDHFGNSVSISGDYCIVGAHQDDDSGIYSGSAYIFARDGNNWTQQAKLLASDGDAYDSFGYQVSICDDYAIVGARGDDDKGIDSGSAYIFVRGGNNWLQQAKLTASDGTAWDLFGSSVSISGDYAIVGDPNDADNGYSSGSAYIFGRDGENWLQQTKLLPSDNEEWDHFGNSVSISGDYCVVGALFDDDNGSTYIFVRDGDNWTQQAKLTAADGQQYDNFGSSVSVSDDYAIVGAKGYDGNGYNSGSAYIFVRDGDSWLQQTKLTASDSEQFDYFGFSVSISGDECIVGALLDDDNGSESGSAYVFSKTACGPENTPPIADAGPDQTVYTTGDEAEVTLDGSGSYDPDDDELTYTWFSNDPNDPNGQVVIATGVSPTIFLPIGEHTIDLIVNDGQDDSEPDQVVITVALLQETSATNPSPVDGAVYVNTDVTLAWTPGVYADFHEIYFGTSWVDVNDANRFDVSGIYRGYQLLEDTTYTPAESPLELGKTYYWRIDEVNGLDLWKGDVWSFTTVGSGTPGLVGWWKFDENMGTVAYDSASDNDGTLMDGAGWTTGVIGGAVLLDGVDDYVLFSTNAVTTTEFTLAAWANQYGQGGGYYKDSPIFSQRDYDIGDNRCSVGISTEKMEDGPATAGIRSSDGSVQVLEHTRQPYGEWHHYAMTVGSEYFIFYIDGVEVGRTINEQNGDYVTGVDYANIGRHRYITYFVLRDTGFFNGAIDDIRIYDGALSNDEVWQIYEEGLVPVTKATNPTPADGAVDIDPDVTLVWTPGSEAYSHDVYFGTNYDEVNDANLSDLSGIYRGTQDCDVNNYIPPENPLELDKTYYWRIDEANGPDIWKGNVWTFTTGQPAQQYLVIDDMESYSPSNSIYDTWVEATSRTVITLQTAEDDPNYVRDGQSMRYYYSNIFAPYYSEARASIADLEIGPDWTVNGSQILTLYFRADMTNLPTAVQPMAVFVSDGTSTATVEYDDPNDLIKGSEGWKRWNIDLQQIADAGVDLTNITEMRITIGDVMATGVGTVYFDDIRLYPSFTNTPPVADAGPDQTVYVPDYNSPAEVTLDGSGSYDPDDDELTYEWFMGGLRIATGVNPTIFLPVGQHTIDLIVNDGQNDSEPDQVVITVVFTSDIEAELKLAPKPFSCDKPFGGPNKNAWFILNLILPEGFLPDDVDTTTPAIFTPGEVESAYIETSINDDGRVVVETVFEHDEICDALPPAPNGLLEITVTGLLTDGRYFYGTATMKVMQ